MGVFASQREPQPKPSSTPFAENEELKSTLYGLDAFSTLMDILGKTVKRDENVVGLELLHMLSAYTPEPANIGVEGPTSEGKTYPAVQVAKLFPKEDVWMLGALSPTALAHDYGVLVDKEGEPLQDRLDRLAEELRATKDPEEKTAIKQNRKELMKEARYRIDLECKILVFLEDPARETWARLRPILSHDVEETTYKFTDRMSRGSPLKTRTAVLRGWPVAVYFRAAEKTSPFWDQMATRFTTVSPEMTQEKYREAIQLIAMRKGLPHSVYAAKIGLNERKRAKAIIRLIKERLVAMKEAAREKTGEYNPSLFWIPFHGRIGDDFPGNVGRHMRDVARFLTVIQLSAACNVFARPTIEVGGLKQIIVTREDYERARQLYLAETAETIFTGVPGHVLDFFKKVLVPLGAEGPFYMTEMVNKHLEVYGRTKSRTTIRLHYLPHLMHIGLIDEEPDPNDKRRNQYRVLRTEILDEKTVNYGRFRNDCIFSPELVKDALDELKNNVQITPAYSILNFDGSPMSADDLYKRYYSTPSICTYISGEEQASTAETTPKLQSIPKLTETTEIPAPTQERMALGDLLSRLRAEWVRRPYTEFDDLLVEKYGYTREEAERQRERWEDEGLLAYDPEGYLVWV